VLLRFFENKSLMEVGQALGMSDDTAQKRLTRALEKLRAFFARKGVQVSVAVLVPVLAANAVQAAPVGLASGVVAASMAGVTGAGATTLGLTLMEIMTLAKLKMAAVALLLAAVVATPIVSGVILWRHAAGRSETRQVRHIKADDILPYITPGPGGIPVALLGQRELLKGNQDGEHNPAAAPGQPGCYGLAWLVKTRESCSLNLAAGVHRSDCQTIFRSPPRILERFRLSG
jgi:multisubunit Na+/H+ antiporter MnhG subunit